MVWKHSGSAAIPEILFGQMLKTGGIQEPFTPPAALQAASVVRADFLSSSQGLPPWAKSRGPLDRKAVHLWRQKS